MHKYKPIAKNYDHRPTKHHVSDITQPTSDSEQELFQRLLQGDSPCMPEGSSSIELLAYQHEERQEYYFQQEEESPCEEEVSYDCFEGSYALARINAEYLRKMGGGLMRGEREALVRFESTIRVKFFSDEQPVSQVGSSQEYITTFNQYNQECPSDEERQSEPYP